MTNDLTDKVTIITGASSGIGKACANLIASFDGKIVLVDINQEKLDNTVTEIKKNIDNSANIFGLKLNVCDEAAMKEMAAQTLAKFGRIDCLIASAGILRIGNNLRTVIHTPLSEWETILQTVCPQLSHLITDAIKDYFQLAQTRCRHSSLLAR